MSAFDECLALVLAHEGGYVNHPRDPGGETNRGVTRRVYDAYRRSVGQPVRSVRHITSNEVAAIYRRDYWDACAAPRLPRGVDYATFDGSVNSGVSRGVRWLQSAVGASSDGKAGPRTISAAKAADPVATVRKMCAARMGFLRSLGTFSTFGRGWSRRVAGVEAKGIAMAAVDPMMTAGIEAQLAHRASKAQSKAAVATGTGAAGVGGAGATQVDPTTLNLVSTGGLVAAVVVVALIVVILVARSRVNRDRADAHAAVVDGALA